MRKVSSLSLRRIPLANRFIVGFTGSGKPMSKDQVRAKWNFSHDDAPEE